MSIARSPGGWAEMGAMRPFARAFPPSSNPPNNERSAFKAHHITRHTRPSDPIAQPGQSDGLRPLLQCHPLPEHDLQVALWDFPGNDTLYEAQDHYDIVRISLDPAARHSMWLDGKLVTSGPTLTGTIRTSPPGARVVTQCRSDVGHLLSLLLYIAPSTYRKIGVSTGGLRRPPDGEVDDWLAGVARQIVSLLNTEEDASKLEMGHLLLSSVVYVARRYGQGRLPIVKGGLSGWQLKRAVELLEQSVAQTITIDQLAKHVSLSPFHFIRAFHKSIGTSPCRYLGRLRVDKAKELLTKPSVSIGEISTLCGFREAGSLSRAFKESVGMTPIEFRRRAV